MEMARYGGRIAVLGFPGRNQPAPAFNPCAPSGCMASNSRSSAPGMPREPIVPRPTFASTWRAAWDTSSI